MVRERREVEETGWAAEARNCRERPTNHDPERSGFGCRRLGTSAGRTSKYESRIRTPSGPARGTLVPRSWGPPRWEGTEMPGRLRWYVGAVGVAGLLVLARRCVPTIDLDRVREVGGAIALFTCFVVGGELVSIRLRRDNRVKDLAVTTTFAYGLVPLAGTAVAVLVFIFASVVADLGRGKPAVQDAVQRRPVRARAGRRRVRLPRPRRRLRDHHGHPAGPGRRRAGLHGGQPPAGERRDQPRPGPAHPPGAAPRRPAPGAGQLGHGARPGPGGGGGGRAQPAAAAGPDPAPRGGLPGLQGRGAGQARPGRGRGGGRAPAPPHHPGAGGRPPPPGGRPAQGRPDRHRLP